MLRFILISNCVIINNNGYCWLKPSSSHNTSISSFNFVSFQYLNAKSSKFGNPGSSSRKLVKDRDDDDDDIWPQPGIWILNCHAEIRTGERLDWLVSAIDIWKCICTLGLRVVREFLDELMYILYSKQRKSRKKNWKMGRREKLFSFFFFFFFVYEAGWVPMKIWFPIFGNKRKENPFFFQLSFWVLGFRYNRPAQVMLQLRPTTHHTHTPSA